MERSEAAADESLAAIRARIKLGIAIAAMIRMIATTISSSISEKPFCCFRISIFPRFGLLLNSCWSCDDAVGLDVRTCRGKAASYLGSGLGRAIPLFSVVGQTKVSFYCFGCGASCQNASRKLTIRVSLILGLHSFFERCCGRFLQWRVAGKSNGGRLCLRGRSLAPLEKTRGFGMTQRG